MSDLLIVGNGYGDGKINENPSVDVPTGLIFAADGSQVVSRGDAPLTFEYEVISPNMVGGCAYNAAYSSQISGEGSVAVFSRGCAFNSFATSASSFSNSASCYGALGFGAWQSSSQDLMFCSSSVHDANYIACGSSNATMTKCASIFPTDLGVYANKTSTCELASFETMTYWWSTVVKTPTMFRSSQRSFINNKTISLGSKSSLAGSSGSIINTNPLNFIWASFATSALFSGYSFTFPIIWDSNDSSNETFDHILTGQRQASYRFVSVEHQYDWSRKIAGTSNSSLPDSTSIAGMPVMVFEQFPLALVAIITATRNGYESIYPPGAPLMQPEDGSTSRYIESNGNLSLSTYYGNLFQ